MLSTSLTVPFFWASVAMVRRMTWNVSFGTYCAGRRERCVFETEVDCFSIYFPPALAKSKIHQNVRHLMSIN
jgi:hypothetical protein